MAAVCHPLAARPPSRVAAARAGVEMERLRIEPAGELDDLRLVKRIGPADEPLPDAQVIEVDRIARGRRSALGHKSSVLVRQIVDVRVGFSASSNS